MIMRTAKGVVNTTLNHDEAIAKAVFSFELMASKPFDAYLPDFAHASAKNALGSIMAQIVNFKREGMTFSLKLDFNFLTVSFGRTDGICFDLNKGGSRSSWHMATRSYMKDEFRLEFTKQLEVFFGEPEHKCSRFDEYWLWKVEGGLTR